MHNPHIYEDFSNKSGMNFLDIQCHERRNKIFLCVWLKSTHFQDFYDLKLLDFTLKPQNKRENVSFSIET